MTPEVTWQSDGQPQLIALLRAGGIIPVLVATFSVATARADDVWGPPLLVGCAMVGLATLLTLSPGYRRFSFSVMLAIPTLDLMAILLFQLVPGGRVSGALVALPALFVGAIFRWRGAVLVGVAGATSLLLGEILAPSVVADMRIPSLSVAITGVVAAGGMASVIGVWRGQVTELESQGERVSAALEDVLERKSFVDAIVRTVDVGLAFLTVGGQYVPLNPRQVELTKLAFPHGHGGLAGELGEIYAEDNATRLTHDQLPTVRAMAGEEFSCTLWAGKDAATRHALAVSGRPFFDEDGAFAGAVIAYHDITTLMRSLAVKDQFVASVSHELRTPLASIMGHLEMAQDDADDLPPDLAHHLAVADRNAARLLHLVSDLLTVANPEDVVVRLSAEEVDLSELVRLSVLDADFGATLAEVDLTSAIAPDLRLVGDRGRLMQVVENLLSNAVKFTPPGGQVVVVLHRAGPELVLTVEDTGIGVPEDDQAEVFTRFFRARNAHELVIPGVGLGLAICQDIVEAHGGRITLESREGEGTTVRVTLAAGVDQVARRTFAFRHPRV